MDMKLRPGDIILVHFGPQIAITQQPHQKADPADVFQSVACVEQQRRKSSHTLREMAGVHPAVVLEVLKWGTKGQGQGAGTSSLASVVPGTSQVQKYRHDRHIIVSPARGVMLVHETIFVARRVTEIDSCRVVPSRDDNSRPARLGKLPRKQLHRLLALLASTDEGG